VKRELDIAENGAVHQRSEAYDYAYLLRMLNELPPATRTVVNLFMIDGYTHKEIGSLLGISENTSKWHASEGRKLLQHKLNLRGHE